MRRSPRTRAEPGSFPGPAPASRRRGSRLDARWRSDATRSGTCVGIALASLSGFAALGYEIVWTEQLGIWLGHELGAVLAVLCAFFGGIALGAQALGRRIDRSARPWLWYAGCEIAIAVWAAVLGAALPAGAAALSTWIGAEPAPLEHGSAAFLGTFALLLPACAALGATLPALERAVATGRGAGHGIGALYAANTAGAVLGVLSCAFLLVPRLGLAHTACVCALLNLVCASVALAAGRRERARAPVPAPATPARLHRSLGVLACTGALGVGYEVLAVRVLGQVAQNTVYTFALLLAVYLTGTAAGAAAYQRWLFPRAGMARQRERLLLATAAACLFGTLMLEVEARIDLGALRAGSAALGGAAGALAAEAVLASGALLLPALAMGALYSELCIEARRAGIGWGPALACNTAGAALAPLLFGVLLVPALGPQTGLLAVALGYLLLSAARHRLAWMVCALGVSGLAPPLVVVDVPEGGRILHHADGVGASVSVVEDAAGVATLHIDNREQEGSSATLRSDARQAWLPLLLHPDPHRALFLGLGTGVTAGSAAWDPELQVDVVELLPEVAAAAPYFAQALESARRPRILLGDARRYVRTAQTRYDVVVADLFHPARAGAGALYTVEHFAAVRARLAPGALFCQWLPLHQLDLETLRSIVAAFLRVYPGAWALLATNSLDTPVLGLVAQPDAAGFAPQRLRERIARTQEPARLAALRLEDELAVLGSFVAGPRALHAFAGDAAPNTDDRPLVAHRAPFLAYQASTLPRERLATLLRAVSIEPSEVLPARTADASESERLAAYWDARNRFIELGMHVQPDASAREQIARLREPLLAILQRSPEFQPAYDPLLRMADVLMASDARAARTLLARLIALQPRRDDASRLLERLASEASP